VGQLKAVRFAHPEADPAVREELGGEDSGFSLE
jgi:hypothetical protein